MKSGRLMHKSLCIVATFAFLLMPATSGRASIIIDSYEQSLEENGYAPFGKLSQYSTSTGPMSVSTASGYGDILSSFADANRFEMHYNLGLAVSDYGYSGVAQSIDFHVDAIMIYMFDQSAYAFPGRYASNVGYLQNITAGGYEFFLNSTDGSALHASGLLQPGNAYRYVSLAEPSVFIGGGTIDMSGNSSFITAVPAAVPEPSSLALLSLGGIGMTIGAFQRRRTSI